MTKTFFDFPNILKESNYVRSNYKLPHRAGWHIVTIRDFVTMLEKEIIKPYKFNRPTNSSESSTSKKTALSVCDNFKGVGIHAAVVSKNGDKNSFRLCDAHCRSHGLGLRVSGNKMKEEDWNVQMAIRVIEEHEFMIAHAILNNGVKHTPTNKLNNPDYYLGSFLKKVSNDASTKLTTTQLNALSYIAIGSSDGCQIKDGASFLCYIKGAKKTTSNSLQILNESEHSHVTISSVFQKKMIKAILNWKNFANLLSDKVKSLDKEDKDKNRIKRILKSQVIFGMLVCDKVSPDPRLGSAEDTFINAVENSTYINAFLEGNILSMTEDRKHQTYEDILSKLSE